MKRPRVMTTLRVSTVLAQTPRLKPLCIYVVAMIVYSKDKKKAAKATSPDVC